MSVSAETYIVISLMFAVFAAVAAVGTSVVLGAGFERLRAGFDVVMRQSGFFADAINKLDQRTQRLDEETAKLRSGAYMMDERVGRVEKQTAFMADAVNSLEQRILQGSPASPQKQEGRSIRMHPVHTVSRHLAAEEAVQKPLLRETGWIMQQPPAPEQANMQAAPELRSPIGGGMTNGYDGEISGDFTSDGFDGGGVAGKHAPEAARLTSLLSRYLSGEQSGSAKGIVYH